MEKEVSEGVGVEPLSALTSSAKNSMGKISLSSPRTQINPERDSDQSPFAGSLYRKGSGGGAVGLSRGMNGGEEGNCTTVAQKKKERSSRRSGR